MGSQKEAKQPHRNTHKLIPSAKSERILLKLAGDTTETKLEQQTKKDVFVYAQGVFLDTSRGFVPSWAHKKRLNSLTETHKNRHRVQDFGAFC